MDLYDDVYDECLFTIYSCILKFDDCSYTFYTYINKALDNRLVSYKLCIAKKSEKEVAAPDVEFLKESTNSVEFPITRLFQNLTQKEILFIRLAYIEKRTAKEISEMYGMSLYSIYSTLKRAKEKIKDNI